MTKNREVLSFLMGIGIGMLHGGVYMNNMTSSLCFMIVGAMVFLISFYFHIYSNK